MNTLAIITDVSVHEFFRRGFISAETKLLPTLGIRQRDPFFKVV